MAALINILVVVVIPLGGGVLVFNGLVHRRDRTQEAWSEIEVEPECSSASSQ